MQVINKAALFAQHPAVNSGRAEGAVPFPVKNWQKIIILDDDPTGTQTVRNIPVLTEWNVAALEKEMLSLTPAFYLLTNTRAYPVEQAIAINREIGEMIKEVSRRTGIQPIVVSRGDSTLRGHFPAEVIALEDALGGNFDGTILLPFFEEGGRYTLDDIHYVQSGEDLVPAAMTPFAKDAVFGYQHSNLKDWVEEKTGGMTPAEDVLSITIEDLRCNDIEKVRQKLLMMNGGYCVVNAACYRDVEVFVRTIQTVCAQGKKFLFRTAASFVPVAAGMQVEGVLDKKNFEMSKGSGLIIVGSHIPISTMQLQYLLSNSQCESFELRVDRLLDEDGGSAEMDRISKEINLAARSNRDMVVYTSRNFISGKGDNENMRISRTISESLVEIVKRIDFQPRYILAKGGITSSDIVTNSLGVKRAMVLGQIAPGVPIWQLGEEAKYSGMLYVIFPGNVGTERTLCDVVAQLA